MEKSGSKSSEFVNKAKAEITRELFKVAVYTSEMVCWFLFEKASKSTEEYPSFDGLLFLVNEGYLSRERTFGVREYEEGERSCVRMSRRGWFLH